jgi:hypothetical protein
LAATFVFARLIARAASTGARDAQFWFKVGGLMVLAALAAWAGMVLSFVVVWSLGS